MKLGLSLILLISFLLASTSDILAQNATSAAQTAENLRAQLLDVQAKEAALQEREQQLDEALRPENIERALAGIGSTRPEELRELRRRQLQSEKASVLAQLEQLAMSRARLETAIAAAAAEAYQQSAQGINATQADQMLGQSSLASPGWLGGVLAAVIAILGIGALIAVIRRR
jgi:hypothetical protein